MIALIIISSCITYAICATVAYVIVEDYNNDEEMALVCGILWPLTLIVIVLMFCILSIKDALSVPFKWLYKVIKRFI